MFNGLSEKWKNENSEPLDTVGCCGKLIYHNSISIFFPHYLMIHKKLGYASYVTLQMHLVRNHLCKKKMMNMWAIFIQSVAASPYKERTLDHCFLWASIELYYIWTVSCFWLEISLSKLYPLLQNSNER